ncbi:filamin A-interacting protein 1-like isoform X5 [Cucumis melo var. makuwa]|uniref:Filamin A-interacting protein 1-like isoform X5 n=1 Tax=Cucumis melo var. makuwa TaxID=1194695 RepID=A0A5D3CK11_CUCMM|nr:filamin A-interacting protein 1-like isoform X5 [Cucumis melo var. makuwa]TYK10539.1 filamin A-interacting protein 1-like isoform X5 [Cucumis melo var. makuwa]
MNLYAQDLSALDFNFGFSEPYGQPFSRLRASSAISSTAYLDEDDDVYRPGWATRNMRDMLCDIPPIRRHDGSSPLPLGMDWSPPPQKWDGPATAWPHDPPTGWSYCVTVPSWTTIPKSNGSDPVVFYMVQVGLQSPEGITSTRGISRRFNEFLELFYELKRAFPKKQLPPAPPKRVLRMKNSAFYDDRKSSLEEWMEKMLSDIDVSRSVPVASFLELEAAVRSFFSDVNHQITDEVSSGNIMVHPITLSSSTVSIAPSSSVTSSPRDDTCYGEPELGAPRYGDDEGVELGIDESALEKSGTDMENLVVRSNEEMSERQFLAPKDEQVPTESTIMSILEENKILLQELDGSREQIEYLQKQYEEFVMKPKADFDLFVKEIKSLRGTQSDLRQECSQMMKEKSELERILQTERQRMEQADIAKQKLLHDCEVLHHRLQDSTVDFFIEQENKLILETASTADDAIDLLATSDNHINLLLAEAKLLAHDANNNDDTAGSARPNGTDKGAADQVLSNILANMLVENARLRMQMNAVIRCVLNANGTSEKDEDESLKEELF